MPTGFEENELFPDEMPERNNDLMEDADDAIWTLLSVYADGEATPEEAAEVEALLKSDPALARELSFLQMSAETVHSLAEVEPPACLTDSILNATTRRKTMAQRLRAWRSSLAAAFAPGNTLRYTFTGGAVAAGLLAVLFFSRHEGRNVKPVGGVPSSPPVAATDTIKPISPAKTDKSHETVAVNTPIKTAPAETHAASAEIKAEKRDRGTQLASSVEKPKPTLIKSPLISPVLPKHNDSRLAYNNHDNGTNGGPAPISVAKLTGDSEGKNRHMVMTDTSKPSSQEDLGAPLRPNTDDEDTPPKNPVQPAVLVKNDPDTGSASADSQPKVTYGALKIPARPPLYVRANADIKKEAEAQRGGYTAETLKGIERHEVTVSLIGGKF